MVKQKTHHSSSHKVQGKVK